MRSWIATTTFLVALLLPAASGAKGYDPARPAVQRDALGILRDGPQYLADAELPGDPFDDEAPFEEIDARLATFLEYPDMQPSVQFSCAVMDTPGEARLAKSLHGRRHARALLALAALVHVHSPSTVEDQLAALARLRKARPKWKPTLDEIEARFDPEVLAAAIALDPPKDDPYGDAPGLEWAIRAVGVRQQEEALPRLATLCQSEHLHTSLAAERSIEDFAGPKAEAALASCVEAWQYDAADRAFDALRDRNRALALKTLLTMTIPAADARDRYVATLIDIADGSAVPRLIELIPLLDDPSHAIDALETHAEPRHRAAIRKLVPHAGEKDRERLRALADRLSG